VIPTINHQIRCIVKRGCIWPPRRTAIGPKLDETAWTTSTHWLYDNDDDDDDADDLSAVFETVQKVSSVSKY